MALFYIFLFYDRPFLYVCNLEENLLFSTLILGSVFNDHVVFYRDLIMHFILKLQKSLYPAFKSCVGLCMMTGNDDRLMLIIMPCFSIVGSERRQRVKQLMMKLIAQTADQQRQISDYQATVRSLTENLDSVSSQLTDCQQTFHDSGIAYTLQPLRERIVFL